MSVTITMNMKQSFFDRQAVIEAVDKAERRAMSRSLSFIRQTARRDVLRRRKSSSKPGRAPSVHSRDPKVSLRNILFAYDAARSGGVVGPVRLNGSRSNTTHNRATVPALLEAGGTMTITEESWVGSGQWRQITRRRRVSNGSKRTRKRRVQVQPRPFMQVAFERELAKGNIINPWHSAVVAG